MINSNKTYDDPVPKKSRPDGDDPVDVDGGDGVGVVSQMAAEPFL